MLKHPSRDFMPQEYIEIRGARESSLKNIAAFCVAGGRKSMSTFENRPNSALLVVDVQNGVIEGAYKRDAVFANIGRLIGKARRERVPIIWVQHSDGQLARGSNNWRIVAELNPGNAE